MKELQLYSQLTKTTVHSKIIYASNITIHGNTCSYSGGDTGKLTRKKLS